MKKYILFLVVTFICLWKTTIANAANDRKTVTVEITKDTTIYVRHLFKDVKLYADFGTNGGNVFDKNNKSLNPKNHVYVLRDKEKTEGIRLVFKENDIKERQIDVKFYGQDSKGNCLLSDIYKVIVNIKPQTVKTEKPSNNNLTTPEKSHDEGKDKNMEIYDAQSLSAGAYGIMEPQYGEPCRAEESELRVVPGVAFAEDGRRLGRGKGYYDRYLSRAELRAFTVGVCYGCQLRDDIPAEPHDKKVDMVVVAK